MCLVQTSAYKIWRLKLSVMVCREYRSTSHANLGSGHRLSLRWCGRCLSHQRVDGLLLTRAHAARLLNPALQVFNLALPAVGGLGVDVDDDTQLGLTLASTRANGAMGHDQLRARGAQLPKPWQGANKQATTRTRATRKVYLQPSAVPAAIFTSPFKFVH